MLLVGRYNLELRRGLSQLYGSRIQERATTTHIA